MGIISDLVKGEVEEIAREMCDDFCKYPNMWDEDKEGYPLWDSEICRNCPLNRL